MSWVGLGTLVLSIAACGPDTVATTSAGGGSGGSASNPETSVTATSMATPAGTTGGTSSGTSESSTGIADSSSGTGRLLPCANDKCGGIPIGQTCLCPEGLECAPDGPLGHVHYCFECDCPPDTQCWGDAVGGYNCVSDGGYLDIPDMGGGRGPSEDTGSGSSSDTGDEG